MSFNDKPLKFMDYFDEEIYGLRHLKENDEILPFGLYIDNANTTFLNAFINQVTIISAFVVGRYVKWDEILPYPIHVRKDPFKNYFEWIDISNLTKLEAYNILIEPKRVFHSKLNRDFQDDVVILGKLNDSYWLFWYDCDTSDSSIGRFKTEDAEDIVINSFCEWIKTVPGNEYGEKPIPLHYFQGWLGS